MACSIGTKYTVQSVEHSVGSTLDSLVIEHLLCAHEPWRSMPCALLGRMKPSGCSGSLCHHVCTLYSVRSTCDHAVDHRPVFALSSSNNGRCGRG